VGPGIALGKLQSPVLTTESWTLGPHGPRPLAKDNPNLQFVILRTIPDLLMLGPALEVTKSIVFVMQMTISPLVHYDICGVQSHRIK
jgi:hypothetical protein